MPCEAADTAEAKRRAFFRFRIVRCAPASIVVSERLRCSASDSRSARAARSVRAVDLKKKKYNMMGREFV